MIDISTIQTLPHYVRALAAFYVSETWNTTMDIYQKRKGRAAKRFALYCKARCVVCHDRVLNGRNSIDNR